MNKTTRYIVIIAIVAVLVGLFIWSKSTPGQYDNLATCLKNEGVKFYGAFWCPHCQAEKKDFGKSTEKLPYIECSNPDGQSQDQTCNDAHITGYPTWEFPKNLTISGTDSEPSVACKTPYTQDQPSDCDGAATGSWVTTLSGRQFLSPSKPSFANGVWTLPPLSRTSGEVQPEELGALANCSVK